jgi:flavodoxin
MKALITYDSIFGNTEKIARAIWAGIGSPAEGKILRVGDVTAQDLKGLDLLIIGSPTRQFGATPAINSLLTETPANGLKGVKVAAFDTRISLGTIKSAVLRFIVNTGGYAARNIADRLKRCGGILIVPPQGFYVTGEEGPLQEGELEHAADWARQIKEAMTERETIPE